MSSGPSTAESSVVFVVDDAASVRVALDSLLRAVGFDVRCFGSVKDFQQSERPDAPACLVLDVRMPGMNGLDFQRELVRYNDPIPIIFITGHGDIPMSVRAMKAGAVEFLSKPFSEDDLLHAIRAALSKDRARREAASALADLQQRFDALTSRERDVVALIVSGRRNKQIAAKLGVSEITVKVSRGQIMRKTQARSLPELVRMADRLGISFENN